MHERARRRGGQAGQDAHGPGRPTAPTAGGGAREPSRARSADSPGEDQGHTLVHRAPSGYLWNQAYSLWLGVSLVIFDVVLRRSLSLPAAGAYVLANNAANLGIYLASLGLTSAAAVYIPRALSQGGPGLAMTVALRLVTIRVAAVAAVAIGALWGLPLVTTLLAQASLPGAAGFAQAFGDPRVLDHRVVIAGTIIGTGIAALLASVLTALLRTRVVFIVGGLSQLLVVILAYIFIHVLGAGVDGALGALVLPPTCAAVVYAFVIRSTLAAPRVSLTPALLSPMLRLGMASWLADMANVGFFMPLAAWQLSLSVSSSQIALFSSAYQLGHGATVPIAAGISGISLAIMSAAYTIRYLPDLALAWRTIVKLQVLLTVPLMVFCVPHAGVILQVFGKGYATAGGVAAVFIALSAVIQLCGGIACESVLYVLGHQVWVVVSRWGTLAALALGDWFLIPRYGVLGGLIAVGFSQIIANAFMLVLACRFVASRYPIGFVGKMLVALTPGVALTLAWRPASPLPLVLAGLAYGAIFLVCLRLIRPLDAEDGVLLTQVPTWLRTILRPFVTGLDTPSPLLAAGAGASGSAHAAGQPSAHAGADPRAARAPNAARRRAASRR
ncbi:MAG TPA: hypothetical protein VIC85_04085 [Ktedonobacterales bacterium]